MRQLFLRSGELGHDRSRCGPRTGIGGETYAQAGEAEGENK